MTEEKNSSAKNKAISWIKKLPEGVSLDEILYHLYVKQKISKGLDDIQRGKTIPHEKVKEMMEEKFRLVEEQMSVEQTLNECCKMRGNPTSLVHRTVYEFDWFYQNLIFDKQKILKDKYSEVSDSDLIEQITHRTLSEDDDPTLRNVVRLFHLYCKHIYKENKALKS